VYVKSPFFWDMTPCSLSSGQIRVEEMSAEDYKLTQSHVTDERNIFIFV